MICEFLWLLSSVWDDWCMKGFVWTSQWGRAVPSPYGSYSFASSFLLLEWFGKLFLFSVKKMVDFIFWIDILSLLTFCCMPIIILGF